MITTIGQVLTNHALPKELQDYGRVLDKKGIERLLQAAAKLGPETYRDVAQHLATAGWQAAQATGANSFGPQHLRLAAAAKKMQFELRSKIRQIHANPELDEDEKESQVVALLRQSGDPLTQDILKESLADHNPLALQVISGARGNPTNLRSLRGADLLYVDHKNRPIPIPILNSYSQGLTPAQYFAGTFGARKGVVDTKFCLAPWTKVRLWSGESKRIVDLQRGDTVVTYDFDTYRFGPTKVVRLFDNGPQRVSRFYFQEPGSSNSIEICGTDRHRVLTTSANKDYPVQGKRTLGEFRAGGLLLNTAAFDPELEDFYHFGENLELAHVVSLGLVPSFDIQVSSKSHLYVLENGAIVSNSVRNAGFSSKQFNQLSHRLVVSAVDDDERPEDAPPTGLPVEVSDPESEGSLLSLPVGGYPRNTLLTPRILADLSAKGVKDTLVRTPLTSHHELGGIYARDGGVREHDRLANVGENLGLVSSQSLSEPLLQMTLGSKHAGGVASSSKLSGFELLNQQVQIPSTFKGGAAHAQIDGRVTHVREAPQGGTYIEINGQEHYVGRGFKPLVAMGDLVEAGDVLSEGTPNPAELVKHKHLGEGQRQFVNNFRRAYAESNAYGHRRNIETLARGLINHVQLTGEMDSHVPGDIVPYSSIVRQYKPREDSKVVDINSAADHYLEHPVLHYSIGTKIRPSVVRMLQKFNVKNVAVHKEPPPFRPIMVRAMDNLSHDPDWMTRFLGSNVKKNFLAGVHRSHASDEAGSSYVPSLARGIEFGQHSPVVSAPVPGPVPKPPNPAESILAQLDSITAGHSKAAASDTLTSLFGSGEDAGDEFYIDDFDDDDDCDDYGYVHYCAKHVCLPGYTDELGRNLTALVGEDETGRSGAYQLFSADMARVYTKPFYKLTIEQYDSMARAYGTRLAAYPIHCADDDQFYRLLQAFKDDPVENLV